MLKRHPASIIFGTEGLDSNIVDGEVRYDELGRPTEARELLNFAAWAFGPNGFHALQVLAYGDFSYGNRCAQQNTLLCRRSNPVLNSGSHPTQAQGTIWGFQEMLDDDWDRVDHIDASWAVLEACPVDYLLSPF